MKDSVQGLVDWKGDKWNGAVSIDNVRYNFKKGVNHSDLAVGDYVELSLAPWEFKGKTGMNVVSFKKVTNALPKTEAPPVTRGTKAERPTGGRDFDKEARGKTFCAYLSAMLSNPNVPQDDLEKLFMVVTKCVEKTFDA